MNYKNEYIEKMISEKINSYSNSDEKELNEFCNKDNVICYFDKKIFPMNRVTSSKTYQKISYKNSYNIFKNGTHLLEITVYEVK
jgi:hypothetical protein